MNNTHAAIIHRRKSSISSNNNVKNKFFELLGNLRDSGISITPKQSDSLYKTLLQNEEKHGKHDMVMSHANFLRKLANENAARAAKREAEAKRNRQLGRANAANVARGTRKASRKSSSRRTSNNASSGYASGAN